MLSTCGRKFNLTQVVHTQSSQWKHDIHSMTCGCKFKVIHGITLEAIALKVTTLRRCSYS